MQQKYIGYILSGIGNHLLIFPLFVIGLIFFTGCYLLMRLILHRIMSDSFEKRVIYDVAEKCISALQGILATTAGLIITSNCKDIMYDRYWLTDFYAMFALPYFYYDTWAGYQTYIHKNVHLFEKPVAYRLKDYFRNRKVMMCHHILLPTVLYPVIIFFRKGIGDYFVSTFFLFEFTVPFISLRHILAVLEMKASPFYVLSGVLMVGTFFIARVLIFPCLYWKYAIYRSISIWDVPAMIPLKCNLGCLFVFVFQVYWFILMVRGLIVVLFRITKLKRKRKS